MRSVGGIVMRNRSLIALFDGRRLILGEFWRRLAMDIDDRVSHFEKHNIWHRVLLIRV